MAISEDGRRPLPLPDNLGELKLVLRAADSLLTRIEEVDEAATRTFAKIIQYFNWLKSGRTDIEFPIPSFDFPAAPLPSLTFQQYATPLDTGVARLFDEERARRVELLNEMLNAKMRGFHPCQYANLVYSSLVDDLARLLFPAQDLFAAVSEKIAAINSLGNKIEMQQPLPSGTHITLTSAQLSVLAFLGANRGQSFVQTALLKQLPRPTPNEKTLRAILSFLRKHGLISREHGNKGWDSITPS